MSAVRFNRRGDMYAVTFAYDPGLVEVLKTTVPSYARKWVPARREWHIEDIYAAELAFVLRSAGYRVVGLDSPRQHGAADPADWARALFRRVGPARAAPVYRALSKCLHPDVGGSTELQRELNDGYRELPNQRKESA